MSQKRSTPFVLSDNGNQLLAIAITGKQFATRPSTLLGLEDPAVAVDLDVAAALRLLEWEDEREAAKWRVQ